jgi:hypothetical protein
MQVIIGFVYCLHSESQVGALFLFNATATLPVRESQRFESHTIMSFSYCGLLS